METKHIDIQQSLVITESIEDPGAGYVGLGAKADGLYEKLYGGVEKRILKEGDVATMASKTFWSGTLAAYTALAAKDANTIYFIED